MYEVVAVVKQLGIPTWFMTLSPLLIIDGLNFFKLLLDAKGKICLMNKLKFCHMMMGAQCLTLIQLLLQSISSTELKHSSRKS